MSDQSLNGLEQVHGTDDRVPVQQPQLAPWPAVCALRIIAANAEPLNGTGFLIGPSAVLTTGHNLFDFDRGGPAQEIRVIPDARSGAEPFGQFTSKTFKTAVGWKETRAAERDYGVILLDADPGSPARAGSIRCRVLNDAILGVAVLTVAGYPRDMGGAQLLVRADGHAATVATGLLIYDIDTNDGQSGSPILTPVGGAALNAVGIHISGNSTINQGVRITQAVLTDIQTWRTQHA